MTILGDGKTETIEVLPIYSDNDDLKPCPRTSHSSCVFKDKYIFIIGGERDEQKLDDIWAFDIYKN